MRDPRVQSGKEILIARAQELEVLGGVVGSRVEVEAVRVVRGKGGAQGDPGVERVGVEFPACEMQQND